VINSRKNRKSTQAKSLSGKYLLLFLTTAFIPAIIICLSLLFIFQALKAEIVNSNQASTRLIQQSVDIKISEIKNTILQMSSDPTLTRYSLENKPTSAISTLKQLTSLQECLDDIIVWNKGDEAVYSSTGRLAKAELVHQAFIKDLTQSGYSSDLWMQKLAQNNDLDYWPTNVTDATASHLYLFSPIYNSFQYSSSDSTRTAVFLINQDFLHSLFRSSQTSLQENILLLNSEFEVLSYIAPNAVSDEILEVCEKLKNSPNAIADGYMSLKGDNLVFVSRSYTTGLYCVRFLPKAVAYQSLYRPVLLTAVFLFFALVVSIVLIRVDMKNSYLPIRTLADSIISIYPHRYQNEDELSLFKKAYDDAHSQKEQLSKTIDNSMQGLINHLMATLLQGRFTEEAFRNACHDLSIQLDMPYFCVCSILFEDALPIEEETDYVFSQMVKIIKKDLPDNVHVLVKDMLFEKRAIVLMNCDCCKFDHFLAVVRDMKTRIYEETKIITSIGVGSPCLSFDEIGKSYLDSINALDYRMIYGKDCLITPDMCQNHLQDENYPSYELKQLHVDLSSRNTTEALDTIQKIYEYIKSQKCSLHSAKYICYDVLSVIKGLPDFPVLESAVSSENLDISNLVNFETIDDFFQALLDIIHTRSNEVATGEEDDVSTFCERLMQYIQNYCFHYDFQINRMAEHFHISPQHMRKLFKQHTGMSISDYIAQLKLQRATLLLKETDMSINDIVLEIGNSDVSGFMRFFKKYTNQTPGQYRKKWQQTQLEQEEKNN